MNINIKLLKIFSDYYQSPTRLTNTNKTLKSGKIQMVLSGWARCVRPFSTTSRRHRLSCSMTKRPDQITMSSPWWKITTASSVGCWCVVISTDFFDVVDEVKFSVFMGENSIVTFASLVNLIRPSTRLQNVDAKFRDSSNVIKNKVFLRFRLNMKLKSRRIRRTTHKGRRKKTSEKSEGNASK